MLNLQAAINKSGKSDIIIKSLVWNSVGEVFKQEKNIDISKNLVSISFKGETIFIKTDTPVINFEANILSEKIKNEIIIKFGKVGIQRKDFLLRFGS